MAAFAPEVITQIGSFPITNTILNTLMVDAALIAAAFFISKNIKKVPGVFQNIVEMVVDSFYNLTETIAGKNTQKIFPWFMSFFLFILVANWSGLLPGVGTIGFFHDTTSHVAPTEHVEKEAAEEKAHVSGEEAEHTESATTDTHQESTATPSEKAAVTEHAEETAATDEHATEEHAFTPLIRNATSELNVTLALALISLVATHTLAIQATGIKEYLSRFFSINPILLFVGILEIISEFTKIVSLSFRLFGNIFAGEVVLHTISSLFAFVFPVPFMLLELIVGLVQALVFAMLTMVFMSVLMTPHHAEEH